MTNVLDEIKYLQHIENRLIRYLAVRYRSGEYVEIGRMCDQELDVSGRLLGKVRDAAREIDGE